MSERPRVVVLRNPTKPAAEAILGRLVDCVRRRADVVATGIIEEAENVHTHHPDRLIVLGGDGSILWAARAMGPRQVPIVGVNFGKLGYLAEFSVEGLADNLDAVLTDPGAVSHRMMIEVAISPDGGTIRRSLAINDCVVHAGPPYRMIELAICVNGVHLTDASCDGLVIATPSGSTAHNMSIGGPILQAGVNAMVLSPIAPHSLTHRPLVVADESIIEVLIREANEGTTLVIDGQESLRLKVGDRVSVGQSVHRFKLVHNPAQTRWYTLTEKLKWGQ